MRVYNNDGIAIFDVICLHNEDYQEGNEISVVDL